MRGRKNIVASDATEATMPDEYGLDGQDNILAENSDTECEPLEKRRKHIDAIAQYCRDGGDIYLISTSFRGPFVNNPWARKRVSRDENLPVKPAAENANLARPAKRKRKGTIKSKDNKVNQYFQAQKSSQERELIMKKRRMEEEVSVREEPIVDSIRTIIDITDNAQVGERDESPAPLKAVPRKIDFDQVPQSSEVPTQNFPSLQLITKRIEDVHEEIPQPPQRALDPIEASSEDAKKDESQTEEIELFDAPTPQRPIPMLPNLVNPTSAQLDSIRNLVGEESSIEEAVQPETEELPLFDAPTPPATLIQSDVVSPPPSSNNDILPASLTLRGPPSTSPIKPTPIKSSRMHPPNFLHPLDSTSNRSPSPTKRIIPLQERSPTPQLSTPPLNTQLLLEKANESFNAILLTTTTSPSLLPAPTMKSSSNGFTPFRELNKSPARDDLSFRLGVSVSTEESPLTYSPLQGLGKYGAAGAEDMLWGEVKGFLATWSLDEDVAKYSSKVGDVKEKETEKRETEGSSTSQNQGVSVGA
jgi:hypothetical protein